MACERDVPALTSGSYRNHCPYCLASRHVDVVPGDRAEMCRGLMPAIGVEYSAKKGWVIIHHCTQCGAVRKNKAALDDAVSDNFDRIIELSVNPH